MKQGAKPKQICSRVDVRHRKEETTMRRPPAATIKASTNKVCQVLVNLPIQFSTLSPTCMVHMSKSQDLREQFVTCLFCDTESSINLVSEKKVKEDSIRIKDEEVRYDACNAQGCHLDIVGHAFNYIRVIGDTRI